MAEVDASMMKLRYQGRSRVLTLVLAAGMGEGMAQSRGALTKHLVSVVVLGIR